MLCPECNEEEMLILEFNDVEIDYCNECSGIWLDEGELELLIDSSTTDSPIIKALVTTPDSPEKTDRRCPVCNKRMYLSNIPVPSKEKPVIIEIDKCPRNHGLWFDKGELKDIISAAKGGPVADFLGSLFENS